MTRQANGGSHPSVPLVAASLRALILLLMIGCTPAKPPVAPLVRSDLAPDLEYAIVAEALDPLSADPYLRVLEKSLAQSEDSLALGVTLAALDALVWRDVAGVAQGVDHAIAYRSLPTLVDTARRLRRAWRSKHGSPLQRGAIAAALHQLALRVGADKETSRWRRRAGCASPVTALGPLGFPPLASLDAPSPIDALEALPQALAGVAPFATSVQPETIYADACALDLYEVSSLRGERVVVVDVDNPTPQAIWFALTSSSAATVDVGGKRVLARSFDAGGEPTVRFGVAHVAAGQARVVVRVASNQDGQRIALQLLDQQGKPLRTRAPRPGAVAAAEVRDAREIDVAPRGAKHLVARAAALLATGDTRRASHLLEGKAAPTPADSPAHLDVLRMRAMQSAELVPRNQMLLILEATAARALERCPECWEARITAARVAQERQGYEVGLYALLAALGVDANDAAWRNALDPMSLSFVAHAASTAHLDDVARTAFDGLAAKVPHAPMLADLDAQLFRRHGSDRVAAACAGGISRATSNCYQAHTARSDFGAAMGELERLRRLRGSPAILRDAEMQQLLLQGRVKDAMRIYHALSPARRMLALLGAQLDEAAERESFARDMRLAADAPHAYEPLARMLGVIADEGPTLDREGARLVARDREAAFLPGAGTAVLRHHERYRLAADGTLYWSLYDLRRVSGTVDVADGTWMGAPLIDGRAMSRVLRRRIYKQDGRVLDPDPTARGSQGSTELSQLQVGDYVEALVVGWALPGDSGQLVADTPDMLPLRTSMLDGELSFTRPRALQLSLWSHPLLGAGVSNNDGDSVTTTWSLKKQSPRRIEEGVPPLEARVGMSFGTDSWERIARALDDRFRALDERDPTIVRWARQAVGEDDAGGVVLPTAARVDKLVAAIGKVVVRGDGSSLSDFVASIGGGSQRETARWILEQGTGSRTWVVHRALRALGIRSEIAVAESRPFSAAPDFPPRPGRFTHPLVRADIDGKRVWIDADVDGPPLPPGRISPELRGRRALLGDGSMIVVDADAGDDVDEVDLKLRLDAAGNARGSLTLALYGRPAQFLAEALELAVGSEREQMLRNVVLGWVPWADVVSVALTSDEGASVLAVVAEIEVVGYARPESRESKVMALPGFSPVHMVFPQPRASTLAARFGAESTRTTALSVDQPLLYRVRRQIELPPGTRVVRTPDPLALKTAHIEASRTVSEAGGIIQDEMRLNLPVTTVDPEAYVEFARNIQRVDDAYLHATRIEMK